MMGRGIVFAEFLFQLDLGIRADVGRRVIVDVMHKQTPLGGVLRLVRLVRPHRPVPVFIAECRQKIVPVGPLIEAVEFADEDRHVEDFLRGIVHLAVEVRAVSGDVFNADDISKTVEFEPVIMEFVDDILPAVNVGVRKGVPVEFAGDAFHDNDVPGVNRADRLIERVIKWPKAGGPGEGRVVVQGAKRFIQKIITHDIGQKSVT